jgi:hypothetical protein
MALSPEERWGDPASNRRLAEEPMSLLWTRTLPLDHVAEALRAAEDDDLVREGVEQLLLDGGGASRQRAAAGDDTDLDSVAQDLLRRTQESFS